MNALDKLRAIISGLADDGSRELAREKERQLEDAMEMHELMQNPAFRKFVDSQRSLLTNRLRDFIASDIECRVIYGVLVRTVGSEATEEQVTKAIDALIDSQ